MENKYAEKLCRSLAGHDTGRLYVVLREEGDFCYLADGKIRTLDKPKKKRKKHVQMIIHLDEEILALMTQLKQDSDVIRILRVYSHEAE